MEENVYLVIQMCIEGKKEVGNDTTINMFNIVRRIRAKTDAEAIGKFVLSTNNISAVQKLNIECFNLDDLISC